jgi:cytochrome b pre-mRNA-processing protein 3
MFARFRRTPKSINAASSLYDTIVARAREPIFHTQFGVADTLDGRFDLLTVHAFVVMDVLKSLGPAGQALGTALANLIFSGLDDALRQLGVSDVGMGRRIKAMANAFYGRLEAYGGAADEGGLAASLLRNLYRGDEGKRRESSALAHYIAEARSRLRNEPNVLLEGRADFGPLPIL